MKAVFAFLFALGAAGVFVAVLAAFWIGKYFGLDQLAVATGLVVSTLILVGAILGVFVLSELDALRQAIERHRR